MNRILITLFCLFFSICHAQDSIEKKVLNIKRTKIAPKIDGVLNDNVWKNADIAKDFIQFRPAMGTVEKDHQKTLVKVTYDNNAIYFGAYLHDNPNEIAKQFSSRDNFGQTDFFGIVLNPNNDAQNDTEFFVFPSGNQADAIANPSIGEDFGWNAVWESAVRIVDDGWIVEVKIPYSALRFSNQEIQTWGLQFHRHFRTTREQYTWNPYNPTKGNIGLYHGEIHGINNIQPPTRLSFYPFASGLVKTFDGDTSDDFSIGMDVKYGISENFTLDATLIPDFSQVAFDNVRLNLGPFEQQFSEQRQFFTEGVDLFTKGNLFYSRRIGSNPVAYGDVYDDLIDTEDEVEEVIENPEKVNMLNAVKVSGRTKKGLGIGFFNAITEKTVATVENKKYIRDEMSQAITDSIISQREFITEPFANYNIVVLDQQFNKNSSISIINTNVTREGHFRDANVFGAGFDITDKANKFNYEGSAKFSSVNLEEGNKNGLSTNFEFSKISGKYRYSIEHDLADRKYDKNDMGIQFRNNYNNIYLDGSYRIFEPTKKLNNLYIGAWFNYLRLYKPSTYTGKNVGISFSATNKKLLSFGGNINYQIGEQHDYFEPRDIENNRFFTYKDRMNFNAWFSSDYNKTFALDANVGLATLFEKGRSYYNPWFGLSPRFKLNDKFVFVYSFDFDNDVDDRGYVTTLDNNDIIFGQRNRQTIVNSISGSYNFNSLHSLTLTFRNYWSTVNYEHELFKLQEDGLLTKEDNYNVQDTLIDNPNQDYDPNENFDIWNLDFKYSWQFAPGSQLTALYRNQLFNSTDASRDTYFESISDLFKEPMEHVFSLRLTYYIDYNNLKNVFKGKGKTI